MLRGQLRTFLFSCCRLLRYEDVLPGHELYRTAVLAACRSARILAERTANSIEDRLAGVSLKGSPLQEVSLWMDGILQFRCHDGVLLLAAAEVYAVLGMATKALRCLLQCPAEGTNYDAVLHRVSTVATDEPERGLLVSVQGKLLLKNRAPGTAVDP